MVVCCLRRALTAKVWGNVYECRKQGGNTILSFVLCYTTHFEMG